MNPPAASWRFDAIGTRWQIDSAAVLDDTARARIGALIDGFDREWSRFRPDSLVSALAARGGEVPAPEDATPMLDLYADWCVACKEFEKYTFTSPEVQQALKETVLLQVDVTKNSARDAALLKHLQVLGLPTILFFNEQGEEQPAQRVTGFMDAAAFSAHLRDRQP